ncbi:MAG: hypothetical protein DRJ18_03150, partial [Candidatus Methanomethylicota archaeon]
YVAIKLIDHVILNQVISRFFLGHSLSVEENHVLKEFIRANCVCERIKKSKVTWFISFKCSRWLFSPH